MIPLPKAINMALVSHLLSKNTIIMNSLKPVSQLNHTVNTRGLYQLRPHLVLAFAYVYNFYFGLRLKRFTCELLEIVHFKR